MSDRIVVVLLSIIILGSCRKDATVLPHEEVDFPKDKSGPTGFYLLNEGNMGMNKASLDYIDLPNGIYKRNIYNEINPTATKELGDVGNDIQVYGAKLYAVINLSDKVEVLEAATAKRIGQINIKNCRYVTFDNDKAYVSSYAGNVGDPYAPNGFIAEIDTATLEIKRQVTVGRQPEEMAIIGNKLYISNSGGYSPWNYERTVSVIDLVSFTEIKRIDVAINLHRLKKDNHGDIYVTSRGDYYTVPSKIFIIDSNTDKVKDSMNIAAGNLCINGDSAYVYSVEWSYVTNSNKISYSLINVKTEQKLSSNFITDGTDAEIQIPYGLMVNPYNNDVYVTDAKDYVTPGKLYCFDKYGKKKWSIVTGDIPAHFTLIK